MNRSLRRWLSLWPLLWWATAAPASAAAGPFDARLTAVEAHLHRGAYRAALEDAGAVNADAPLSDRRTQSAALTLRARALADLGQLGEAGQALDAALQMLANTPHIDQLVEILVAIGELRWEQGEVAAASDAFEEARAWNMALGDRRLSARIERARARLARLEHDHPEALAGYARARARCDGAPACVASALTGEGLVHVARGDAAAARRAFSRALATLGDLGLARDETRALRGLATAHRLLGELDEATAVCERALAQARRINHRPLLAGVHALRGELALEAGARPLARGHLEAAYGHYAAMRSVRGVAESRLILARLSAAEGRRQEAAVHARAARRASERMGDARGLSDAHRALAALARADADPSAEARHLEAALAQHPPPRSEVAILRRLSDLARGEGRRDQATALLRDAVDAAERLPITQTSGEARERLMAARLASYDALLDALLDDPHPDADAVAQGLATSERSVARSFLDVLERARLRRRAPRLAALLEALDGVARKRRRLAAAGADVHSRALAALGARQTALEQELQGLSPRLLAPTGPEAGARIARALDEAKRAVRDDVVLLKYHLAEPRSWLFTIDDDGVSLFALPGRGEIATRVEAFQRSLQRPSKTARQRARQAPLAEELHELLLAPASEVIAPHRRLLIVPPLERRLLPFDALALPARRATREERRLARRNRTPVWALYRYTISYAPSVAALVALHEQARRRARTPRYPFVAFADPVYEGAAVELPRLARASTEARDANRHVGEGERPGSLFLREQATEERLKALALSRYRIVHLATHGFAPDTIDAAQQPALFLGKSDRDDGVLRLEEVLDLRLDADLVVLSACSSGRGSLSPGEGIGGLTRAFLYAGSSAVLATLWAVEDRHAASMMDTFYAALARGAATPDSLRDSRLAMLDGAARPIEAPRGIGGIVDPSVESRPRRARPPRYRSADPFFWASYVLVGESGDVLR